MKKIACVSLVFLFSALVFGASILENTQQMWRVFESARVAFESGEYGKALTYAEEAKRLKKTQYEHYLRILSDGLKPVQVQREGDALDAVLAVLRSRDSTDASAILQFFASKQPPESIPSVSRVIEYIQKMSVFPEADFLIGRVYLYESELLLAREYYTRAWDASFALDIPDERYNILYEMADLALLLADDELYEQALLLVLADDPYYNTSISLGEMEAVLYVSVKNALEKKYELNRIFQMYRATHYRSLTAYIALAKFYREKGMKDEFLKNAVLGSLTAFSRMYEIVSERNVAYEYKGVRDFFSEVMRYRDVVNWSIDQSVWDCFYYLFEAASERGHAAFANEMIAILASLSPDLTVRDRAQYTQKILSRLH